MRITVASGKGGAGKTTVAASLALSLAQRPGGCLILDADVEAPNAHIFLQPRLEEQQQVDLLTPSVDEALCIHCGKCAEACQYHAILDLGQQMLVMPQLCHGCGSCTLVCPTGAIREEPQRRGVVERGPAAQPGLAFARGVLDEGQALAVPVTRALKRWVLPAREPVVIVDAPPGAACPMVEAARGADYLLLVTEPTPFGLHDLRLAVGVARALGIPAGVIVNRDGIGDGAVDAYCEAESLPILLRIPFERAIAAGLAGGSNLVDIYPAYRQRFLALFAAIAGQLGREEAS
jgi:MinD superfamily P-loop ATPase